MSVYKDKKTDKYYCSFRITDWTGKRKQIKKGGFVLRKDAVEYERRYLEKTRGSITMTFGALVDLYMADAKTRLRPTTYATKEHIVNNKILPYLKDVPVSDITPATIREWQNAMIKADYSKTYLKTINNQMTAIFNYAMKYYGLAVNPATVSGSMGKKKAAEMQFWTLDEYRQFAAGLECDPTLHVAFDLLFWTGMREGELLALTLRDLDLKRGGLYIRRSYARIKQEDYVQEPKTEKSRRFVECPDFLITELSDYAARLYEYEPDDRLFPFTKNWLSSNLRRCCERTGVKVIRVHDIRHSHASMLIEQGVDPLLVSERLGHESVSTTLEIYSHLYPGKGKDLAAILGALRDQTGQTADAATPPDDPQK